MNKTYRNIYNESLGAWVAVPETVKARGKKSGSVISSTSSASQRIVSLSAISSALMLASLMLAPTSALAECNFSYQGSGGSGTTQVNVTATSPDTAKSCTEQLTKLYYGMFGLED